MLSSGYVSWLESDYQQQQAQAEMEERAVDEVYRYFLDTKTIGEESKEEFIEMYLQEHLHSIISQSLPPAVVLFTTYIEWKEHCKEQAQDHIRHYTELAQLILGDHHDYD